MFQTNLFNFSDSPFLRNSRFLSQLIDKKGFGLYSVLCLTFTTVRLETLPQEKPYNFCVLKTKFSAPFHTCLLAQSCCFILHFSEHEKCKSPEDTLSSFIFSCDFVFWAPARTEQKTTTREPAKKIA